MLRMDGFEYLHARTAEEALSLWHQHPDAMYVAGGTDLLPNLKHRILRPRHLVGIGTALPTGSERVGDVHEFGAGIRLATLARDPAFAPLATAAACVAGPQIRNMGTLGGNVLLDTRCLFFNQSAFWRESLGHCLKADGDWCHVLDKPKTCVATQSSDTVPMLLALNASIRLLGVDGPRELSLRDLYRFNGVHHLTMTPGDLLTHVLVPATQPGFRGSYQKVRTRGAIDFPQLAIAIAGTFSGMGADCQASSLEIVVGAVNPQPKPVKGLEPFLHQPLTGSVIDEICDITYKRTRPQASVQADPAWRRGLTRVLVRRALHKLRDDLPVPPEG